MPKPAVVEASAMGSATLIVKATRSGRREVRANRRRCSVEGLGSRCVLRALWVSVVRCVSDSMGVHAPANLASFSLHKQNGWGVRAGRAERRSDQVDTGRGSMTMCAAGETQQHDNVRGRTNQT